MKQQLVRIHGEVRGIVVRIVNTEFVIYDCEFPDGRTTTNIRMSKNGFAARFPTVKL